MGIGDWFWLMEVMPGKCDKQQRAHIFHKKLIFFFSQKYMIPRNELIYST